MDGNGNGNGRLWRHVLSCCHTFMAAAGFFWSVFQGSPVLVADAKLVRVDEWYGGGGGGGGGGYTVAFFPLFSFVSHSRRFSGYPLFTLPKREESKLVSRRQIRLLHNDNTCSFLGVYIKIASVSVSSLVYVIARSIAAETLDMFRLPGIT